MHDVDGVNAGYARLLLDEYLENPEAVPPEWRALFESGDSAVVRDLPGLARLLERLPARRRRRRADGDGAAAPVAAPAPAAPRGPPRPSRPSPTRSCSAASPPRWRSSRRTGCTGISRRGSTRSASEPIGDPALDPLRLEPKLTPELQARIPASILRIHVDGRDARGGAAAPQGDLLRLDGLRDRAHRRPRAARLAAQGDRVVAVPHAARAPRSSAGSTRGSARSRAWSATSAARSSGRSSSRSRASTS